MQTHVGYWCVDRFHRTRLITKIIYLLRSGGLTPMIQSNHLPIKNSFHFRVASNQKLRLINSLIPKDRIQDTVRSTFTFLPKKPKKMIQSIIPFYQKEMREGERERAQKPSARTKHQALTLFNLSNLPNFDHPDPNSLIFLQCRQPPLICPPSFPAPIAEGELL